MRSDAFRTAIESEDREALINCLAEDVRFLSPVVFRPYEGREVVGTILTEGAMRVFEDFQYRHQLEDERVATLVFTARVGDREVEGLDMLGFDAEGRVTELTVMVRPMSGMHALKDAMEKEFERLGLAPPRG